MQFFIARRWRFPKVVIAFFVAELAFTIPALILFGIADPDTYRTRLWTDGGLNGFNSSPQLAQYAAYNYQTVKIPLVWQGFITEFNVIISVFITFLMLTKAVLFVLHLWVPLLSFVVHAVCTGLFAYSASVQASPDMSDPKHPQPGPPWYITKPCSVSYYTSNIDYCQQAKGAFAITCLLTIVFGVNTIWALICCWPSKEEAEARRLRKMEEREIKELEKFTPEDLQREIYEMDQFSKSQFTMSGMPLSPTTPRTRAFNTLGGA